MDSRPVILALMRSYRPGYRGGGPVVSLESLIHHLWEEYDIRIVTEDRDVGDTSPYGGIELDKWQRVNEGWVRYLPVGLAHWRALVRVLRSEEHQLLYINDLLSPRWGIWPLLLRRLGLVKRCALLIAPRGQLADGALGIKWWKKRLFLWFAQLLKLFQGAAWHATNEQELGEIQRWVSNSATVKIASNLPSALRGIAGADSIISPNQLTRLVFFSRISPKKNLEYSLAVLQKLTFEIEYDIYGTIDDPDYWARLKERIRSLPANVKVEYKGELVPASRERTLMHYHAFLFPTLGENFGHVIFESLACGCLPIISDRTPWSDLPDHGCGWVIPLENPSGYIAAITDLHEMSIPEYSSRRNKAMEYAATYLSESRAVEKNREMFRSLCGRKVLA